MAAEEKKRAPRIPLSAEEVAQLVALKKMREAKKLARFKRSLTYKICNIFNVCCFFVYWELLFCFLGPCHYQTHYSKNLRVKRGDALSAQGHRIISEVTVVGVDDKTYKFMVDDFVDVPAQHYIVYQIGKDYILHKELKGILASSEKPYRLQAASPLIFLSVFIIFVSCLSFFYNLNQNPHSLRAVAILNAIALFAFITI